MRHVRTGDGGHELGASLDDSGMLGFGAHHEACDVVQEDDRGVPRRMLVNLLQ